jgi:hypothetical protein
MIRKAALPLILLAQIGGTFPARAQDLPAEIAETIDGTRVRFPAMMHGSIAACVFGFGKDSTDKVAVWLESLTGNNINAWSVVNLEPVPSVARGPIRISMRVGTPAALLERSLIIAKDYKEWKKILEIQQDNLPVVVLFDAGGKIVWKRKGTFSAGTLDELKAQIAQLPQH